LTVSSPLRGGDRVAAALGIDVDDGDLDVEATPLLGVVVS
jgi:hypothetical protein